MMWQELSNWEDNHNAIVYGVMTSEDVRESLSYWNAFDKDTEEFICDINDVSETLVMASMKYAYNTIEDPTYEYMLEVTYDHLVDTLKERIKDAVDKQRPTIQRGYLWNSETKEFEKVSDFLKQRQAELNLKGGA
jgi:hypothetical protein